MARLWIAAAIELGIAPLLGWGPMTSVLLLGAMLLVFVAMCVVLAIVIARRRGFRE